MLFFAKLNSSYLKHRNTLLSVRTYNVSEYWTDVVCKVLLYRDFTHIF